MVHDYKKNKTKVLWLRIDNGGQSSKSMLVVVVIDETTMRMVVVGWLMLLDVGVNGRKWVCNSVKNILPLSWYENMLFYDEQISLVD